MRLGANDDNSFSDDDDNDGWGGCYMDWNMLTSRLCYPVWLRSRSRIVLLEVERWLLVWRCRRHWFLARLDFRMRVHVFVSINKELVKGILFMRMIGSHLTLDS